MAFEVLLYIALVLSRLRAPARVVRPCIVLALVVYTLSRVVQTTMLIQLFATGYARMQATASLRAVYWVSLVLALALSGIQCYTFYIYGQLYLRCGRRPAAEESRRARPSRQQRGVSKPVVPTRSASIDTTRSASIELMIPAGSGSLFTSGSFLLDTAASISAEG